MDSSLNTVEHLQVKLGKLVFLVRRGFLDISQRGSIDNVADNESLDCLVLGDGLSSGNTTNALDVSASLLVASVVASLNSHCGKFYKGEEKYKKLCEEKECVKWTS